MSSTEKFISYMIEQYGQEVVDDAQGIVDNMTKLVEDGGLAGVIAGNIFFQLFMEEINKEESEDE